jgi:hypothetical protein
MANLRPALCRDVAWEEGTSSQELQQGNCYAHKPNPKGHIQTKQGPLQKFKTPHLVVLGHGLQHVLVEGPPYGGDSDECGGLQRMDCFDEAAAGGVLVRPLLLVVGEGVDAPGGGHEALQKKHKHGCDPLVVSRQKGSLRCLFLRFRDVSASLYVQYWYSETWRR